MGEDFSRGMGRPSSDRSEEDDASLVDQRVPAKTMRAGGCGHTAHAVRSLEDR
ncbi:Uncharacterised protein [Burkholderia pseudomallei]|nr:Uncharacterised protein [Burkholderia pseudomallei]CFB52751.1 Uncharacterised protein [Burkholderia pseudomallei]CFD93158.1 Uncharacterised protein [Burkholderia pseudomallei]CFK82903.1 Uncharacterised protein [Burkholderia pseudomallei]CFK91865.1 Uncharacterised protein [Burkholderia pseudomallei]